MSGRAWTAAALAAAAVLAPGGAQAATVGIETNELGDVDVVYRAAAGEENDVRARTLLEDGAVKLVFEESGAPLTAGDGCTELAPGRVECDPIGSPSVLLGDEDDRYELAEAGAGWEVSPFVRGGDGDDEIVGHPDAIDFADGGPGEDTVGGEADTRSPLLPDDCHGGGPLTGCHRIGDHLSGGPGDDLVLGGSGQDDLDGGPGDDELRGGTGGDLIHGGDPWQQVTGSDDDVLVGGAHSDGLVGGDGDDVLRLADAHEEQAECGPGDDTLAADARDQDPDGGCERVIRCGVGGALDGVLPGAEECVRGIVE